MRSVYKSSTEIIANVNTFVVYKTFYYHFFVVKFYTLFNSTLTQINLDD